MVLDTGAPVNPHRGLLVPSGMDQDTFNQEPQNLLETGTMIEQTTRYGISCVVDAEYDTAVERTKEELAKEGFGVLSEIDIAATLKKKLDVDFRPYVILGACNPPLAYRALNAETDLGLLLPCNLIVYASDEPGRCIVAAMDPEAALELTGNPEIRDVAREVRTRLERVLRALETGIEV
jgi:uncharacterized protein (DUF302 family)